MMCDGTIEACQVVMPTRRRRIALLILASLLGALLAYSIPMLAGWKGGVLVVFAIALVAGVSALWSP